MDEAGALYVHVKVYKQSMVYGEVVASGGPIKIRCRNCLRWHRVIFRANETAALEESPPPEDLT